MRERLIEAASGVLGELFGSRSEQEAAERRDNAADVLAAVLPLIADEIEGRERLSTAIQRYTRLADAALVRSWAADGAR